MRKTVLKLKPAKAFGTEDYFVDEDNKPILCRQILSDLFTLPANKATPISLVISGKKIPDSYEVNFNANCNTELHYDKKWNPECLTDEAEDLVRELNLADKKVWVSLYWEE